MKSPFLPLRGSVIISDERQSFDYRGLKPQIRYAARFRRMLRLYMHNLSSRGSKFHWLEWLDLVSGESIDICQHCANTLARD